MSSKVWKIVIFYFLTIIVIFVENYKMNIIRAQEAIFRVCLFNYKSFSICQFDNYCLNVLIFLLFQISVAISVCFCSAISYAQSVGELNTTMYTTCGVLGVCLLLLGYSLSRQPQSSNKPTFHVNIIMTCVFIRVFFLLQY